ncbi:alpha/beta hydrolase [Ferrovibrio sp.]|uniref:alpha/beta hydrolase n=1 Tax=Ferrovibrio sp. TaxID=1917215 RepID=UPI002621FE01|nr:alpha/beta hydrolase [Ferrovibrio sp.]
MSFDDIPPLPKLLLPGAPEHVERVMDWTRKTQGETRNVIDCKYGADYWQKVDLYLSEDKTASNLPVIIFFHGGAWSNGTKEWMGYMAPTFLDLPAIFVSANYRLAPTIRYPEIVEDCIDAIAWVHRNIAQYGGDPKKLFISGHSAGGHLASLAALDTVRQRARGIPDGAIRGCLSVSGSYDFRNRNAPPGAPERRVYDVVLSRDEDDTAASPITYVNSDTVPFFIAWGAQDLPRLITQADAMTKSLKAAKVRVETLEIANADHFGAIEVAADKAHAWSQIARRWVSGDE